MKVLRWTLPLALVACGGGSGPGTGQLQLQVTDAPVDGADNVVIQFTGIEVQNQNGSRQTFSFDDPATPAVVEIKTLDLLTLQNGNAAPLLTPVTLSAGNYSWLRVMVQAEYDGVMDSYITIGGVQNELYVPSGSQSGLKLNTGFTVPQGGLADFTVDFDLRHSIVQPVGQPGYHLKPVLRMVNNATVGSVAGSVDAAVITAECADKGSDLGAVYVYNGSGVTPDDMEGDAGDPLASANVVQTGPTSYVYTIAFLSPGSYTVSYTCDAASDAPETSEALDFFGTANVNVVANTVTDHDFVLPPP